MALPHTHTQMQRKMYQKPSLCHYLFKDQFVNKILSNYTSVYPCNPSVIPRDYTQR
jgi:hypothetical protein